MGFALVLVYISFYARYTVWSGDFAWGDRYVSTSVQLAALLAVPLLLRYRDVLGKTVWMAGVVLCAISAVIQIASLTFWLPLEIYQMETLGHPTFVILQRIKNIAGFTSGTMMDNFAMHWDPWDYVHITTWNFLPFLLKRVGAAPAGVVHITLVLWMAAVSTASGYVESIATSAGRTSGRNAYCGGNAAPGSGSGPARSKLRSRRSLPRKL